MYDAGTYEIAVIGAGHAGIEAALSAALTRPKLIGGERAQYSL